VVVLAGLRVWGGRKVVVIGGMREVMVVVPGRRVLQGRWAGGGSWLLLWAWVGEQGGGYGCRVPGAFIRYR
jgi:hypothetical protein